MRIAKKENYTHISSDENSLSEFYASFINAESEFKTVHLILLISDDISSSREDFLLLLKIAEQKKENGNSFVIVKATINVDDFPEHFNIVPTLQEAEDIIEMEAIERELGF